MEPISIRYGEDVTLPLDTGDLSAVSADIFIGKPGQVFVLTKNITLTDGRGIFVFSGAETSIPLDVYSYQVNVTDDMGRVEKYPTPDTRCDGCDGEFPKFIVCEALDEIEVS